MFVIDNIDMICTVCYKIVHGTCILCVFTCYCCLDEFCCRDSPLWQEGNPRGLCPLDPALFENIKVRKNDQYGPKVRNKVTRLLPNKFSINLVFFLKKVGPKIHNNNESPHTLCIEKNLICIYFYNYHSISSILNFHSETQSKCFSAKHSYI